MTEEQPTAATSIEGEQAQPLRLDLFADITDQPLIGWTTDGVLFAGELTDEQISDVWWRYTSRGPVDETKRRDLADKLAANDPQLCAALVSYVLGTETP